MQELVFYCGNFRLLSPEEQASVAVIGQNAESNECMTMIGIKLVEAAVNGPEPVRVFSNIDHVFNGVRIGVLRSESLAVAEKVTIIYTPNDGDPVHVKLTIDGRVKDWPNGMFDQNMKNLAELGRGRRAAQTN